MKGIKEITEQLEKGVKEVFTSECYKDYLDTMAKFYDYSANNCVLIMMQFPEATRVAGYRAWQEKFGRQVKAGEKAIRIIAPCPHKTMAEVKREDGSMEEQERQWMSYKAIPVFDVSQTEGKELPEIVISLTGDVEQYEGLKGKIAAATNAAVEFAAEIPVNGFYNSDKNIITVKGGMEQKQTIKTLVHEVAHSLLHCKDGEQQKADTNTREVQAESVAYTVCKYLGIDSEEYSFGYIAGWSAGRDVKELTESMEVIRKTAKTIIDAIEGREAA